MATPAYTFNVEHIQLTADHRGDGIEVTFFNSTFPNPRVLFTIQQQSSNPDSFSLVSFADPSFQTWLTMLQEKAPKFYSVEDVLEWAAHLLLRLRDFSCLLSLVTYT